MTAAMTQLPVPTATQVQIKSEKITPFGGIFHVREQFSRFAGPVIDKVPSAALGAISSRPPV